MPEMHFRVRWPDDTETLCYSPSLVVKEHFEPGRDYVLADFVARSRTALEIASERVRQRYGMPCSLALSQLERIRQQAETFADRQDGRVTVLSFHDAAG